MKKLILGITLCKKQQILKYKKTLKKGITAGQRLLKI